MSETQKVVINGCYGGFGLSWAAMQFIAERKGLVASWFDMSPDITLSVYGAPQTDPDATFVVRHIGPRAVTSYEDMANDDAFVSGRDIARDDADLVAAVEALGSEAASGERAQLRVVEIPADAEWTVEEYDGKEWIAEVHRTWR